MILVFTTQHVLSSMRPVKYAITRALMWRVSSLPAVQSEHQGPSSTCRRAKQRHTGTMCIIAGAVMFYNRIGMHAQPFEIAAEQLQVGKAHIQFRNARTPSGRSTGCRLL